MKVSELINEVRIYRHNSVKVMRVETALQELYPENTPQIKNDVNGIFIVLDKIQLWEYDNKRLGVFMLVFDKDMDEYKSIKKYYVEYVKTIEEPEVPTIDLTADEPKTEA